MTNQQEPTKQELKNIVGDFSNLIMDCSEIRNNFCSELPTEDEARDGILRRTLGDSCYIPDMPNERYLALMASIPIEEVNKVIDEAKRGKKLWDGLESRLSEIRQRLKDPAFKYLPEIFTSEYGHKEGYGNILCFIMDIENEFKKANPYLVNMFNYEINFKNFLFGKLETMTNRWVERCAKKLSQAEKDEKVAETGKEGIGGKNVSIRDIRNSNVVIQIADKAKQEATTGKDRYEELREVLQLLKESVDKLGLEFQKKTELQEQIKEIDREMSSSKPNDKFITKCLGFIKGILVEVPSHMIANQLVEGIKYLETLV